MEVLQPKIEEPKTVTAPTGPETFDAPFTEEQIDAIKYLGLTDNIFNDDIMGKIKEITEYYKTGDLEPIDLKLGNPHGMSRLDKIYSYMKLSKQADDIRSREALIEQAKSNFQINATV